MIPFTSANQTRRAALWKCVLWILFVSGVLSKHLTPKSFSSSTRDTPAEIEAPSSSYLLLTVTNPSEGMNTTRTSFATDRPIKNRHEFNTSSVTMATNETESTCKGEQCKKKCCPNGQLFDTERFSCKDVSLYGINITADHDSGKKTIVGLSAMQEMWMRAEIEKNITCGFFSKYDVSVLRGFLEEAEKLSFRQDFFCNDKMYRFGQTVDLLFACHIAPTAKDRVTIEMIHILNSVHLPLQIISFISILLLVLLLLMYFVSPSSKDLQLKCTVSLGASMLLRLCLRLFYYLYREDPIFEERDSCGIIAVSRIYSYLCVSFWLNVMCFELSRVVRGSLKFIPLRELMKSRWRFPGYFVYSWGGPILICMVILALYLPEELLQNSSIKPSFIPIICLRNPFHMSTYVFSYGPIGLLFIIDTAFMAHIAYLLHKEQIIRFCSRKKAPVVKIRTHCSKNYLEWFKQRLYIYGGFVLMRIIKSFGMHSSNSAFFAAAIILSMSDVLGSLILFFVVVKSSKYSLPKNMYARISKIVRKFGPTTFSKDSPGIYSVSTSSQHIPSQTTTDATHL